MGQNNTSSSKQELSEILTWEYFRREEHEPELTDAEFRDWMAMAGSLHLSQRSGTKLTASEQRDYNWLIG